MMKKFKLLLIFFTIHCITIKLTYQIFSPLSTTDRLLCNQRNNRTPILDLIHLEINIFLQLSPTFLCPKLWFRKSNLFLFMTNKMEYDRNKQIISTFHRQISLLCLHQRISTQFAKINF